MDGAGNRFTVIGLSSDEDLRLFEKSIPQLASLWEPPAEGVLFVTKAEAYRLRMHFFNPDGSTGMMCGNGGRCAVAFAFAQQLLPPTEAPWILECAGIEYRVQKEAADISIQFPPVQKIIPSVEIPYEGKILPAVYVQNGTDHLVIAADSIFPPAFTDEEFWSFPLQELAQKIWELPAYREQKVNVNLVYAPEPGQIFLRTFERGVNAETAACGTGAIAAAVADTVVKRRQGQQLLYRVVPPSQQELSVQLRLQDSEILPTLRGSARFLDQKDVTVEGGKLYVVPERERA